MRESIPKKNKQTIQTDTLIKEIEQTENDFSIDNMFENKKYNNNQITTLKNKEVLFGKLIKGIRQSGNSLLFAILANIESYDIIDNVFVVTCTKQVNYQDITSANNKELIDNILQKIDSTLSFKVQLNEDKTKDIVSNNIKILRETFGKLIKFIE